MNEVVQDKIAQGIEFMSAQRFDLAKDMFVGALELDRKCVDAYVHLGNACVNLGQFDEAIEAFGKALILSPASTDILYSLGCAHFVKGDSVEALKFFNRCEDSGFAPVEMYGLMELAFIEAEDYVQAIRYANKAIKLEPLNPNHYIDKAQLYLLDGKAREALAALREVEELLPDAGEPYVVEAQIYSQNGEPEEALKVIDRAIARFDEDASMLLIKARTLNDLGRFAEAQECVEAAERLAGDNGALKREVAMVRSVSQVGVNDIASSIATLEAAVAEAADDEEMLYLLANECFAVKEYEKAQRYSKQLLAVPEIGPRYRAAAIFWSAMSLKELGREAEAREACEEAISTLRQISIGNPGLAEVYVYRALCNSELENHADAIELIDHVIALMPEDAPGYAFKAQIVEAAGDAAQAKELRDKVKQLDPNFEF